MTTIKIIIDLEKEEERELLKKPKEYETYIIGFAHRIKRIYINNKKVFDGR